MSELTRPIRRFLGRGDPAHGAAAGADATNERPATDALARPEVVSAETPARPAPDVSTIAVDIAESDPLIAYLQTAPGPVEVARLELDSPAVDALRDAGVALVVPLVSQGELI